MWNAIKNHQNWIKFHKSEELGKGDIIPFPKERVTPAQDLGSEAQVSQIKAPRPKISEMGRAKITKPDGSSKNVTNLGWLLRNNQHVKHFELTAHPNGEGHLIAHLHDGRKYETPFASHEVMKSWVNRPVFRGLDASLNGQSFKIGQ
jgi:hypothetical protein